MGCQTEIAGKIIEAKADYVLAVKANQPTLHEGIMGFFLDHMEDDFARVKVSRHETKGHGHGRDEHRTYLVCDVRTTCPMEPAGGLKRIGLAISDTTRSGKSCDDVRYYILSRKLNARSFGAAVRGHWGIEILCTGNSTCRSTRTEAGSGRGMPTPTSLSCVGWP